jgi:hypothetical protein
MTSASSMPSTDQRQDLKSLLECSICLETFEDPRTLPCLHSFCKKCLENFVDGKHEDELNCPVCRGKFTLNEGKNTTLLETLFIHVQTSFMHSYHVFHNTKVIDKSNHCSLLLYQESFAIQRYKPELNHGIKASKELIIFN